MAPTAPAGVEPVRFRECLATNLGSIPSSRTNHMNYFILPEFPFVVVGSAVEHGSPRYYLNHCSPNARTVGSLPFDTLEKLETYLRLRFPKIPKNSLAIPG